MPLEKLPIVLPENINLNTNGNPLDHQTDWKKIEINGKIFTIDPKPFDSPIKRVVTWKENQEHETILLSTKDLWNKFAKKSSEIRYSARKDFESPDLHQLVLLDDASFREKFSGSPI